MQPGPEDIYKCPNCENLISRGSLRSGNTMGAKSYSDGKRIAPMLPEFPSITKCSKCKNIFWIDKAEFAGTKDFMGFLEPVESEFADAEEAQFLTLEDYITAIDEKLYSDKSEELFLRMRVWWAFNDRVRSGNVLFRDETDRSQWEINMNRLKELLDYEDIDQRIMLAEINRNLGDFGNCIKIIQSIDSSDMNWIKIQFKNESLKRNVNVIQLNLE